LDNTIPVRLTLVSASPRRRELLAGLHLPFDVIPSHASERWSASDSRALAILNARRKVEQSELFGDPARVLLGADTLISLRNRVFGKPAGEDSARRMLSVLSNGWHEVITGVCLSGPSAANPVVSMITTAIDVSRVRFRKLDSKDIEAYIASGEWEGKAGAYAIQESGRDLVAELDGAFDNVVGLPVTLIHDLLRQHFGHCSFL
jgi:septum formation protein